MKLNVARADPAGNITLLVLSPVEKPARAETAARLMGMPQFQAEQVGFRCPPQAGGDGRLEMMGGEFCGNATRAFGMLLARERGGLPQARVEASGCPGLVTVDVDLEAGTARAEMPLPLWERRVQVLGMPGTLVHLGGISHLVVEDVPPSLEFFQKAEPLFQEIFGLDAYGVVFLDTEGGTMTPLVKVPATGTLVWEGSCGSGSLAAAIAQSQHIADGAFAQSYLQPSGVIQAAVTRRNGAAVSAWIGGPVTLDPPITVEL